MLRKEERGGRSVSGAENVYDATGIRTSGVSTGTGEWSTTEPRHRPCPRALGREVGSIPSCRPGAGWSLKDARGYTELEADLASAPASLMGRLET